MKKLSLCLVVMVAVLVGQTTASGATPSFVPAGAQLDVDAINDIATVVGARIAFDVMIDTVGLVGPLVNFSYTASWDQGELTFRQLTLDPGGNFAINRAPVLFGPNGSTPDHRGGGIPAGAGIPAGTPLFLLDTWEFTVAAGLVNDGNFDFRVQIFNADSLVGGVLRNQVALYNAGQIVEVQPDKKTCAIDLGDCDPGQVPEPSTLMLILTGAVAVGKTRWLQIRRSS
jgi:hypothetical protein